LPNCLSIKKPFDGLPYLTTITSCGIPELLTVLFIYFGATSVLMAIAAFYLVTTDIFEVREHLQWRSALGLTFGAYATEVFRGALQSIPKGQHVSGNRFRMGTIESSTVLFAAGLAKLLYLGLGFIFWFY